MKKLSLFLIPILLLSACSSSTPSESSESDAGAEEYKTVSITTDVEITNDESGPMTCVGSGALMLDLYFPTKDAVDGDGAEIAYQESYFQLTDYYCTPSGNLVCEVTLPESQYEPQKVSVKSSLSWADDHWQLQMPIVDYSSMNTTLTPTFYCGGEPGTQTDPGLIIQMMQPFTAGYEDRLSTIHLAIGDDKVGDWEFNWGELYLGNSIDLFFTFTISNAWDLPN